MVAAMAGLTPEARAFDVLKFPLMEALRGDVDRVDPIAFAQIKAIGHQVLQDCGADPARFDEYVRAYDGGRYADLLRFTPG